MSEKKSDLINLCGLWETTSQAGQQYLRGRLGGATVLVMRNKFKTQPNQPDWIVYMAKPPPKDAGKPPEGPEVPFDGTDSDIPF
jgi:hypothetical protein